MTGAGSCADIQFTGKPTAESVEADARAVFSDEALRPLLIRGAFSWDRWATLCLCRYVGQPNTEASLCARISRTTLYDWFEVVPGLKEHLSGYDCDAKTRLAAGLHQWVDRDDDSLTARWMAERRCAQFRPPAKQVEITTSGPLGMNVVLTRGDGIVIPPPAPDTEDGSDDSDAV